MMRQRLSLLLIALALSALPQTGAARSPYRTAGQCDGFPRVALTTAPGYCVGLVAADLGHPRGIAVLGSDIYVTDHAGRVPGRGRVLRIGDNGHGAVTVMRGGLNQPNGIVIDARRRVYVAEAQRVMRYPLDFRSAELVLTGLPDGGRHALKALALDPAGGLIVSLGSATDNCEARRGVHIREQSPCYEDQKSPPRASLLRVAPGTPIPLDAAKAQVLARGLRNAAALAYSANGQLFAVSNARDYIDAADPRLSDENLPHDTLVRVRAGAHYGWPYCFDAGRTSPEYRGTAIGQCRRYAAPVALLPPHGAPLGMLAYGDDGLEALRGTLIIALHGFRAQGHRIIAISLGRDGRVAGAPRDVISGWDYADNVRPLGSPSAVARLSDGSILIAEDNNGTLLRLSRADP